VINDCGVGLEPSTAASKGNSSFEDHGIFVSWRLGSCRSDASRSHKAPRGVVTSRVLAYSRAAVRLCLAILARIGLQFVREEE
jgi:hypothetical protein